MICALRRPRWWPLPSSRTPPRSADRCTRSAQTRRRPTSRRGASSASSSFGSPVRLCRGARRRRHLPAQLDGGRERRPGLRAHCRNGCVARGRIHLRRRRDDRGRPPGAVLLGGIEKALLLSESISSYWVQIVTGALLDRLRWGPQCRKSRCRCPATTITSTPGGGSMKSARPHALRVILVALALMAALAFAACGDTQDDEEASDSGSSAAQGGQSRSECRDQEGAEDRLDPQAAGQPLRGVRALGRRRGDGGARRAPTGSRARRTPAPRRRSRSSTPRYSRTLDAIIIAGNDPVRRGPFSQAARRSAT